jgi:hypothetical protein
MVSQRAACLLAIMLMPRLSAVLYLERRRQRHVPNALYESSSNPDHMASECVTQLLAIHHTLTAFNSDPHQDTYVKLSVCLEWWRSSCWNGRSDRSAPSFCASRMGCLIMLLTHSITHPPHRLAHSTSYRLSHSPQRLDFVIILTTIS